MSQNSIGLLGGFNLCGYAPNPIFPYLNYKIDGKASHLFMKDKTENAGMVDEFIDCYKLEDIRCK